MIENLSIEEEDFDLAPVLARHGGLAKARRVFGSRLPTLIHRLNEDIAA